MLGLRQEALEKCSLSSQIASATINKLRRGVRGILESYSRGDSSSLFRDRWVHLQTGKTNTIGIMLMASSIIDKKSPRRRCREEHRATDLRRQTRRKSPSLSLGRLDLSSWNYLKHLKIDISQKHEISCAMLWRNTQHVSAVDSQGRTIWIADAHRDGKRFVVRADEILTAFMELDLGGSLD